MNTIYDRALCEVGPNGSFQKKFDWFNNFFFASLWGMTYMNIFLALVVTPHRCEIPKNSENISDLSWISKYIPTSNDTSGKIVFSNCEMYIKPGESNLTKACVTYHYDKTWYESTVPSSNNWVCDQELKVAHIMSYSKSGEIAGSIFFGWFGDIYGRRLTYIISLALIIFGRLISIVSSTFALFVTGCIIAWIPSWSVVQSATVISMEISSPERRSSTATLRCIGNSIGMCIMPLLYWWLRDWKTFMIVTTVPVIPFLLFSWISVSLNYTILIMRSGEKQNGNPFLEFAWQALAEMPGTFLGAWLSDRIGRRYASSASYLLTAILWILLGFQEMSTNKWMQSGLVGTAIVVINRLATTTSYYVIYLFNMELYPTCLRQSGMSLGNVLSSSGGAIAPYLMYLGRNVDARIPSFILVGLTIGGVISSLLLPETLNAKLPETLEDAQKFGKKNNKCNNTV